jgi:hypothetical protein
MERMEVPVDPFHRFEVVVTDESGTVELAQHDFPQRTVMVHVLECVCAELQLNSREFSLKSGSSRDALDPESTLLMNFEARRQTAVVLRLNKQMDLVGDVEDGGGLVPMCISPAPRKQEEALLNELQQEESKELLVQAAFKKIMLLGALDPDVCLYTLSKCLPQFMRDVASVRMISHIEEQQVREKRAREQVEKLEAYSRVYAARLISTFRDDLWGDEGIGEAEEYLAKKYLPLYAAMNKMWDMHWEVEVYRTLIRVLHEEGGRALKNQGLRFSRILPFSSSSLKSKTVHIMCCLRVRLFPLLPYELIWKIVAEALDPRYHDRAAFDSKVRDIFVNVLRVHMLAPSWLKRQRQNRKVCQTLFVPLSEGNRLEVRNWPWDQELLRQLLNVD